MEIAIRTFTHPLICKRGSSHFFAMTWLNCNSTTGYSLPSIPPTERKTAKNISVGHDSSYRACPFWSFTTWPGALLLVHTCMNPRQRHQVWHQWWRRLDDLINLGPSHPPAFIFPCHWPEVSLAWIWYSPDVLGAQRVQMMSWRHVEIDKVFCHGFCCDAPLIGRLCCR